MRSATASVRAAAIAATVVALATVIALGASPRLEGLEQRTVDMRFGLRGPEPTEDIVVVGIDEDTFAELDTTWPFDRRLHARMIDRLRRAGARQTIYDVQFTEPSASPRSDLALFKAVGRSPGLILATGESDDAGRTRVLGGPSNLAEVRAVAAASNFPSDAQGVIRNYEHRVGRLPSIAAATAIALGNPPFADGASKTLIDFRGPPGTIPSYSFSDVLEGRIPDTALRDRIVVVGGTAPVLQDVHPTSASEHLMPGPEIQANAIWTALQGDPLQRTPGWLEWLAAIVMTIAGALVAGLAPVRGFVLSLLLGAAYVWMSQSVFSAGYVIGVALPITGLTAGTIAGVLGDTVRQRTKRRRAAKRNAELEAAVTERTADVVAAQQEMAVRLAKAAELRDDDTGQHIERMSSMCERVGRELGMSEREAQRLRDAAVLHDVGKIGLPDGILRKPSRLTEEERSRMQRHTLEGAHILAGSQSPILQLAEVIARTHHERWDGTGYPAGLRAEDIPLAGRIAAVCDVYDALISPRPYKPPWSLHDACQEITQGRGTHFDPAVADALIRVVKRDAMPSAGPPPIRADIKAPSTAPVRRSVDPRAERDLGVGAQQDDAAAVI